MGHRVAVAQTAICSTGTHTYVYTHPFDVQASKIGIIACELDSGTQTGVVSIEYGEDLAGCTEIHRDSFTATSPSVVINPDFVIHPGQVIRIIFTSVTSGDRVKLFIGGH